ncbi:uncharacterized protein LTR77_004891 [Saxophila tyrrhenica]|uniref:CCD97-like C-terminal domain-containing protein n=1 Tax=Saxophila tyrrhenica TaxID=1690608 RepID=A0AAV9PAP9_9PEZI|nr:hypothetical protein LTR77_004891 [Saxophila tyrrhenica]
MPQLPERRKASSTASKAPVEDETQRKTRIQTKNRRMRYLELHPEYFEQPSLELADPLLYDRTIRRFLTPHERELDRRSKGYSGVLEANLIRSEAKLAALRNPDPNSPTVYTRAADGSITGVEQDVDDRPRDRQQGWEKWRDVMGLRFVGGRDEEFEYAGVDGSEEFDDRAEVERERLDEYLEGEEERFVGDGPRPVGETGVQDF